MGMGMMEDEIMSEIAMGDMKRGVGEAASEIEAGVTAGGPSYETPGNEGENQIGALQANAHNGSARSGHSHYSVQNDAQNEGMSINTKLMRDAKDAMFGRVVADVQYGMDIVEDDIINDMASGNDNGGEGEQFTWATPGMQ